MANRTTKSIINTIAVHFQEHLDDRPFLKWNLEPAGVKCEDRKLLRTGSTGTGAPNAG